MRRSQLLEEEEKETEEDENFAFLFSKHRHGWFDRTFRTGKVMDDQVRTALQPPLVVSLAAC